MDLTAMEFRELITMRENIRHNVDLLEVCWSCQKVSECRQWLVNGNVPVWLCDECVEEVAYRMTDETGIPLSLTAASQ